MAATSHDVAREAGVSQPTVSRALRGLPGISQETRARILDAANRLAYVPSEAGRSLSTRQTRTIGVVASELTNPFYPELIEPMRALLQKQGYRALLVPDSSEAPVDFERLADGSLDGVIITTALLGSHLPEFLNARRIPFVLVNRDVDDIEADRCVVDNKNGAMQVASLLGDLGHRRIAAIFGAANTSTGRDREAGLRGGLGQWGSELPEEWVKRGSFSYETGYSQTLDLLGQQNRPSALFCGNDVIALGACNAVMARGMRLGRDLTVVGFDDISMAAWHMFQITTVRCDLAEMAARGVHMLLERIQDPGREHQKVILPPKLILRATHGPLEG